MNVLDNFCKKEMVKIRTTKTQKAEMQRVASLLSAPLEKTQVNDVRIRQQKTDLDTYGYTVKDLSCLMSIKSQN